MCIYYVNLISSHARVVNWQFGCKIYLIFSAGRRAIAQRNRKVGKGEEKVQLESFFLCLI